MSRAADGMTVVLRGICGTSSVRVELRRLVHAAACAHRSRTGHSSQSGSSARQTRAPWSSSAWLNSASGPGAPASWYRSRRICQRRRSVAAVEALDEARRSSRRAAPLGGRSRSSRTAWATLSPTPAARAARARRPGPRRSKRSLESRARPRRGSRARPEAERRSDARQGHRMREQRRRASARSRSSASKIAGRGRRAFARGTAPP